MVNLRTIYKHDHFMILVLYIISLSSFMFQYCVTANKLYQVKFFKTRLDHFTYKNESLKFNLKYLISKKYWKKGNAILFYCGNEEKIEYFARTVTFIWELEQKLSAMVVFGEHRYYGESLPFGALSFSAPKYFGYLNTEQVLADYSNLLVHLKETIIGAINSPVIAIGGSYGGMLAAWFRQKYPNIVAGSIASSAPMLLVENYKNCNKSYQIITKVFETQGGKECVNNIRKIWPIITSMNNFVGLKNLTKIFHLCQPLKNIENLKSYFENILFEISVLNFPYSAKSSVSLPAWPVQKFCSSLRNNISNQQNLLESFYLATQVFGNYSNRKTCLPTTNANAPVRSAWGIQICTEIPLPLCMDGINDMFYKDEVTEESFNTFCLQKYGVKPRSGWLKTLYGRKRLESASNIIFSNGMLDPWSAGGILESPNKNIEILKIPSGAHHIDLRKSHPLDTADIKRARKIEIKAIERWIAQWRT